jgi:diacylglycerol kinase family enzyme
MPFSRQSKALNEIDELYASIKNKHWQKLLSERISRIVIAGGDETVRRVVPLLAKRNIPFSILPSGTASNIATSLHQMHPGCAP